MDDILVRQLTRQLKLLNRWLMFLTTVFVIGMIIIGILLFKLITFVNDTRDRISDIQQKADSTLNVQKKLCDSENTGSLFQKSSLCD